MAGLQRRHNKWRAKIRVPLALRPEYDGREFLQKTMGALDRPTAKLEAAAWELALRTEWAVKSGGGAPARAALRNLYAQLRGEAEAGAFVLEGNPDAYDEVTAGIGYELEKIEDQYGRQELPETEQVKVLALQDAINARMGRKVPRRKELELTFSEVVASYMQWWKTTKGLKESNTGPQKLGTCRLFAGHIRDQPIRQVTRPDAAGFMDALRTMDPMWGKSRATQGLPWDELRARCGNHPTGLSDTTMNRHATTLRALWEWAADRGHCSGRNPFSGFNKRLRQGVNRHGYKAWETSELRKLLDPPPKRADLREVILVGLHTGMRINEIAALQWKDLQEEEGVAFFNIIDAKSPAGNRQVPVHPALGWLLSRREGANPQERLWPSFNLEGPGKKPGQDASREFSRFKISRGFEDRLKVFHSFRKNVTRQMERGAVPENDWAQVFGHERGFTYRTYNLDGITLQRKAEIIGLIDYPGVPLPEPVG